MKSEVAVEGSSEDAVLVSWEKCWVISEESLKVCEEDDGAVVSLKCCSVMNEVSLEGCWGDDVVSW